MSGLLLFALGFLCGAGLVFALRRGGGRDLTGPPRTLSQPRPVSSAELPRVDIATASRDEELLGLIRRGRKIEAIKRLRDISGIGLREAKDVVEALERTVG